MHSRCLPASRPPPALTKSQTQQPQCAETDWFLLPPAEREGVKKVGFGSCFGLSTFHLEAVKRDPQSPAEGREAGQCSLSPPLIHAPCPFTNTCTFLPTPPSCTTSIIPPRWLVETGANAVDSNAFWSAPLTHSHLERHHNAMSPQPER